MRYVFMSCDMPREAEALLSAYGECVRIPPLASLPAPVCAHPDMQMALLGGKMIIHSENTALSEITAFDNVFSFILSIDKPHEMQ